jgi:protein phosphatase 1 regulatory subunit 7
LWIGSNKIASLRGCTLPSLRLLSMQSNRVARLDDIPPFPALEELYLSHNGVEDLALLAPSLCATLRVLDVGYNRVTSLTPLPLCASLKELWFNNNRIATFADVEALSGSCGATLTCVYAEGNPFAAHPQYRAKIGMLLPHLAELDASDYTTPAWLAAAASKPAEQSTTSN